MIPSPEPEDPNYPFRSHRAANHYARKFLGDIRDRFRSINNIQYLCLGGLGGGISIQWSKTFNAESCASLVTLCSDWLSAVEPWFDYAVHFLPDYRSFRPRVTLNFKVPCIVESLLSRSVPKLNLADAVHILRVGLAHYKLEDRGCGMLKELAVKEGMLGAYEAEEHRKVDGCEFDSLEEQISGRTWESVFNLD